METACKVALCKKQIKQERGIDMIKKLNASLKSYNLSSMLLGILALFAVYIAQLSSNSCVAWTFEQPKIPQSLIKSD